MRSLVARFTRRFQSGEPPTRRYDLVTVIAVVTIAPVLALTLSVGGELVPDRLVADALVEGIQNGSFEEQNYTRSRLGHLSDNFSECLAITIGLDDRPGQNPLETAVQSRTLGNCTLAFPKLVSYSQGGELDATRSFFRYWHGQSVFVRPSVALFGVTGMRSGAWGLMIGATVLLAWALKRRIGLAASLAVVLPLALATDFADLGDSSHQALALAVALLGGAFTALLTTGRRPLQLVAVGSVTGSSIAFFDLLTAPIVSSLLVVSAALLVSFEEFNDARQMIKRGLAVGIGWSIGYVSTWASKWIIATLVLGFDTVRQNVATQIALRIDGEHPKVSAELLAASRVNLRFFRDQPLAPLFVGLAIVLVLAGLARVFARSQGRLKALALLSPVLIPPVWYEVMSNHTQIHEWITFRAWALLTGIISAAGIVMWRSRSSDETPHDLLPSAT